VVSLPDSQDIEDFGPRLSSIFSIVRRFRRSCQQSLFACVARVTVVFKDQTPVFALGSVQEFLRYVVLSNTNPLIDFLRVQEVKKMIELAFRGQQLSLDVYSFLWCLIFTTAWLDQCKFSQKSFILDRCSGSDVSLGPPSSY
jgi:hypothetical protein